MGEQALGDGCESGRDHSGENVSTIRVFVARALLIGGRALLVATIAVVAWCRLARSSWDAAPIDEAGFTTAWLPNLAFALLFVTGLALPFIALPVGSSVLAKRDGDRLSVSTVFGRRFIHLTSATTCKARLPGKGWGTSFVLLRSRTGWAILLASEVWSDDGHLASLCTGQSSRPSNMRLALRGWGLLLVWIMAVLGFVALGGMIAGLL